jgi:predicted nuclease with RNAse H fold
MIACMWTVGVDLSAENTKTCLASIEWHPGRAHVENLRTEVSDTTIIKLAQSATKIGIDCPFGWPVPFLDFITEHDRGDVRVRDGMPIAWRRKLTNRGTDLFIRDVTGLVPLSVSADRIAHAAMRCAALLAELIGNGVPVDRTGQTGKIVEVYPAASLFQWGLTHKGYKRAARVVKLRELVDNLLAAAPWLELGEYEDLCRRNDDAFDAIIASLTARATVCNQTLAPTDEQAALAAREGWIALPLKGSLGQLIAQA